MVMETTGGDTMAMVSCDGLNKYASKDLVMLDFCYVLKLEHLQGNLHKDMMVLMEVILYGIPGYVTLSLADLLLLITYM
jgi:hypothetical protein